MEEFLHYNALFDIYKDLLTEKQKCTFIDYFFENLTIEEIAANNGVSKNAVSKSLKNIKKCLDDYEDKIRFLEYKTMLRDEFKSDEIILQRISKYDTI